MPVSQCLVLTGLMWVGLLLWGGLSLTGHFEVAIVVLWYILQVIARRSLVWCAGRVLVKLHVGRGPIVETQASYCEDVVRLSHSSTDIRTLLVEGLSPRLFAESPEYNPANWLSIAFKGQYGTLPEEGPCPGPQIRVGDLRIRSTGTDGVVILTYRWVRVSVDTIQLRLTNHWYLPNNRNK